MIYFARKHILVKCSLCYYISSKVFFIVAGYLKQSNEIPSSIKISIGLADAVL